MSEYFYKYRPFDEFTIRTIVNSEIYLSSPLSFNDPFDCWINMILEGNDQEIKELFKRGIQINKKGIPDSALKLEIESNFTNYSKLSKEEKKEHLINTSLRSSLNYIGVYCLSEIRDDLLMFAHYADMHKGVCLEFKSTSNEFDKARKVIYPEDDSLLLFNLLEQFEYKETILRKSKCWKYEKEWRLIHNVKYDSERVCKFPSELLTGIIIGCRFSRENENLLKNLIQNRNIKLYRAIKDNFRYKLNIIPV